MNPEKRTDTKVGLTVVVGLSILLLGIAWAKGWRFGATGQQVRASFITAGGLEPGDPVTISGVKKGKVESVQLRRSDVLVTMEFPDKVDLRRDAQATVMMFELMGGKKVELLAGASTEPLPPNAIINGTYSGDIGTLVAMVSELSGTIRSVAGKADTLLVSLNSLFEGDNLKTSVNMTMADARNTLKIIDRTANDLRTILSETRGPLSRTLSQADQSLSEVSAIMKENRSGVKSLIDSSQFMMADARIAISRANAVLGSVDTLMKQANRENTLLYRLIHDQTFATRIDSTLISLQKLSEQIRLQGIDANIRFFNSSNPVK